MRDALKVLKLFFLDWFILIFMYILGSIIIKFDPQGNLDFVSRMGSIWPSSLLADLVTYLFISLLTVISISYLLNRRFLKISLTKFSVFASFPIMKDLLKKFDYHSILYAYLCIASSSVFVSAW